MTLYLQRPSWMSLKTAFNCQDISDNSCTSPLYHMHRDCPWPAAWLVHIEPTGSETPPKQTVPAQQSKPPCGYCDVQGALLWLLQWHQHLRVFLGQLHSSNFLSSKTARWLTLFWKGVPENHCHLWPRVSSITWGSRVPCKTQLKQASNKTVHMI